MAKTPTKNTPEFRAAVKKLKDAGLISPTTNVARAQPFWIRSGRSLAANIAKYDDLISGKVTAVSVDKLPPTEVKKLKHDSKYQSTKPRGLSEKLLIPHSADEKVTVNKDGHIVISHPKGISRVQIPVPYRNLEQYLHELAKHPPAKDSRSFYAFNFFGHGSHNVYRNIEDLIDDLLAYEAVIQSINSNSARDMAQVYRNLEIVTVGGITKWEAVKSKRPSLRKKRDTSEAYDRRQRKLALGPEWKREAERKANAERQAAFRGRLKGKQKKEYQKDAVKRAAKSRKNRSKGK